VGGLIETLGDTFVGKAIAAVMSSRFGVGNARFRTDGPPGEVDTVAFACYRAHIFERHGLFDESFTTNQDDEFNIRLTAAGERLYFNAAIRCQYYARPSWRKLLNQYWRYGRFKVDVFRKNRKIGSVRQIVPAAWVVFLVLAAAGSLLAPRVRPFAAGVIGLYIFAGAVFMARSVRECGGGALLFLPIAASIHLAYGCGTWWGAFNSVNKETR